MSKYMYIPIFMGLDCVSKLHEMCYFQTTPILYRSYMTIPYSCSDIMLYSILTRWYHHWRSYGLISLLISISYTIWHQTPYPIIDYIWLYHIISYLVIYSHRMPHVPRKLVRFPVPIWTWLYDVGRSLMVPIRRRWLWGGHDTMRSWPRGLIVNCSIYYLPFPHTQKKK